MPATATATRTYAYEAIDASGKRSKGKLEATSESTAAASLKQQALTPLFIGETGKGLQQEIQIPGLRRKRVSSKDLAIFSRQFATMNGAGLSLLRSLAILETQTEQPKLAAAIKDVRREVEGGLSLSAAMARQDDVFPRLMVAMINAGETGGFLDSALDRIATNFEKDAQLRAKIKAALTYPAIVIAFSVLMVLAVLIFIVPIFEHMFSQLGGNLPLPTQIVLDVSHQLWWLAPLTIAVVLVATKAFRRKLRDDAAWRLGFDRFKLRLPVFGKLFTKIAIARFSRNLGTLLSVGVPIMQALDVVGGTTGNAVVSEAMQDVKHAVRDGQPMSTPLARHDIFPPMVTQMIEVGEESGQISAMLEKVADFYDHEVETSTESLTAAIEPLMVVVMGAIIGVLVICLYLPMFTIYQNIQGATS
ncbi:MAG: type II secretion system F family protein [Jatrophihabitans sp.]|uniref:type II secretion system F family protein n=1 Tax=Jatrophihabitans sp. TaxID=1932789 RepID=UPI003F7F2478